MSILYDLSDEQNALLCDLVESARRLPKEKQQPFYPNDSPSGKAYTGSYRVRGSGDGDCGGQQPAHRVEENPARLVSG